MGPAASLIAIKQLGTNGGGFFNVNSAHPYEDPTPLANFLELLAILLIPAALCFTFGAMVKDKRQGLAVFAAMTVIFLAAVFTITPLEQGGNPRFAALGVDQAQSATQSGGNMEGKETRFGIASSTLWAVATTSASNGSVNSMHDSYTPLAGGVPMLMIQLGEVVYGGVGSGLYGMLIYAILAVFIAGLMIGRTPEYLGKKIEPFEMKMTAIAILVTPLLVLVGTAIAVTSPLGVAGVANPGVHGFSEILYALSSAGNNNGSAFAGLSANTPFWNTLLGIVMFFGRYAIIVPVLAIAGSLAAKKSIPASAGTLPTHGTLFVILLIGSVVLVGLLNYVPALALGPVVEQLTLVLSRALERFRKQSHAATKHPSRPFPGSTTRGLIPARHRRCVHQARSARAVAQPRDVRRLHRQHHHDRPVDPGAARLRRSRAGLHPGRGAVAVVHGAVRQLRRGARRRPQQGPGGVAEERP